jgi:acyl carrier protein
MVSGNDAVISDVLRDVIGYTGPIRDDMRNLDIPGWDSVAHISIVEALEQRFGVRLTTEEMIEMGSIQKIKAILGRHGVTF